MENEALEETLMKDLAIPCAGIALSGTSLCRLRRPLIKVSIEPIQIGVGFWCKLNLQEEACYG